MSRRLVGCVAGVACLAAGCERTDQGGASAPWASGTQFVAVVGQCDAVITGDTLAVHVAISRRAPTVALFGPTCAQEIDLFDTGRTLVSPLDCGPCYRRTCDQTPDCMDAIGVEAIVEAAMAVCRRRSTHRVAL